MLQRLLSPCLFFLLAVPAVAEPLSNEQLWAEAESRIEQHRKGDAQFTVVDAQGQPVPGARVVVEQTRHAFLFGCNFFRWRKSESDADNSAYEDRFAALFNYATLPFYWATYEGRQGQPNHEATQRCARWCAEHGIAVKGHPLVWNYADPRWLPEDPAEIRRLQMDRVDDCVARFAGLIDRWDVVNEATHYDRDEFFRRAPKLTPAWKQFGQIAFAREAFLRARAANPQATLLINDYRTDPAYAQVIEQLVDDSGKRLYDAIGIQSHMHGGAWTNRTIWEVCERFARFDVPLHFTETTIVSGEATWDKPRGQPWPSTPEGEARQAQEAVRFYTMVFSHPAVEALTWWDFADRGAWKNAPAGFLRGDLTPKPAYDALIDLVRHKWWTKAERTSDAQGLVAVRGFLGDYHIVVVRDGRQCLETRVTIARGANRFELRLAP